MKSETDLFSADWLKPIINLIRDGDFSEAYALAEQSCLTPSPPSLFLSVR